MTHNERFERRKAIAEYLQDHTVQDTINKFKISYDTIRNCAMENGFEARVINSRHLTYPIIAMIQNTNLSYSQIAKEVNCTKQNVHYVSKCMRKYGIKFIERGKHD